MMSTQSMGLYTTIKTGAFENLNRILDILMFFLKNSRAVAEDENCYYGADDETQRKEADWAQDNNSNFDPDD